MVPVHCFFLNKSRDIDTVWTKWIDEHEENVLSRVSRHGVFNRTFPIHLHGLS
jgi:hypothetical protein